jgi:hypothetical protein
LAAAVPSRAQNTSSVSTHCVGSSFSRARRVISGAASAGPALAGGLGQRAVDQLQPGPRHQALERDVRELLPGVAQDGDFALVARREAGVAAFGAQRDPAVGGRDQARHAQAAARPEQADHAALAGLAAAHLAPLRAQARQRHRQRGEVVHHHQRVQPSRWRICSIENCQW